MTPDADHWELRFLLGAYLLGGLGSTDRSRLEDHLAACADCGRELVRLAPVPGLLGRLREQAPLVQTERPSADMARLLIESHRERRGLQRRAMLATLAAAVVVVAAVIAAVVGTKIVTDREPPTTATVVLAPATGYDTAGSAGLLAKPWGMAMTLRLRQMPMTGPFRLEVTGRDGSTQVAATWAATATGVAVVSGAAALAPDEVDLVRVVGPDGLVLHGALVRPG